MSSNTDSSTDDSTERQFDCPCGRSVPFTDSVTLPGVGNRCRHCHTPFPLAQWPDVIDEWTAHHRTGESTLYQTRLVGLDEFGRGVYFDQQTGKLLLVVPKYHPDFQADIDGDEHPLRTTRHRGPGRGDLIESPERGGGVLVAYDRIDTDSGAYSSRDMVATVARLADNNEWDAICEWVLDKLAHYVEKYSKDMYDDDVYPVAAADRVIDTYSGE